MAKLSKSEQDRLLEFEVTDRNYISQPQLQLIQDLLGRHSMWDWSDFRQVCQEAFCEHDDMELDPDQTKWEDLTRPQASAVIDYLGQCGPGRRRSRSRDEW